MAGKLVALILMAVVAVNAKTLDGAKTHTSKPKKDKAPPAPAAAAPSGSAAGGSPPATAAKCARATVTTPLNGLPTLRASAVQVHQKVVTLYIHGVNE